MNGNSFTEDCCCHVYCVVNRSRGNDTRWHRRSDISVFHHKGKRHHSPWASTQSKRTRLTSVLRPRLQNRQRLLRICKKLLSIFSRDSIALKKKNRKRPGNLKQTARPVDDRWRCWRYLQRQNVGTWISIQLRYTKRVSADCFLWSEKIRTEIERNHFYSQLNRFDTIIVQNVWKG